MIINFTDLQGVLEGPIYVSVGNYMPSSETPKFVSASW